MRQILLSIAVLIVGIGLVSCGQQESETTPAEETVEVTATIDSLAGVLLDSTRSQEARQKIVKRYPDEAVALVKAMTDDLSPGTEEEYRRIPWIWRVSIALGERNNAEEIRQLLKVSLPGLNEPFREWQSVVVGGGIINGITRQGGWPKQRVEEIIGDDQELLKRWEQANQLASKMADNEEVANPYRYDALRMIAMNSWEQASDQLIEYLTGNYDSELQMGAISGLGDMRTSEATNVLIKHFDEYTTERNRNLALGALMRTPERAKALLSAVSEGRIPGDVLGEERIKQLTNSSNAEIRKQARKVLTP